jgi:predicted DNA-binding mobile mystery protein A
MSASDLAARMRISKERVLAIERSEARGSLNLGTLNRAAEALGCTLVYALIPKKPLEETVRDRALEVAAEHLSAVNHTMRLEDQGVSDQEGQRQLVELADELVRQSPRSLWKRRAAR